MIKNTLYSSGQAVTLATGQTYTLKDNEVMINTVIYRKADIEITLENNGVISDSKDVKVGIRKRDGVSGMPAHYENYNKWYIDGTQQTILADCVENINTAIYYTASSGGGGSKVQSDIAETDSNEDSYVKTAGLPTYDSLTEATTALGVGRFFFWSEANTDGVVSPSGSNLGITK